MILIRSASVLTPAGLENADVRIRGSEVAAVGALQADPTDRVLDGSGLVVGPGFVDLHVHFRDPGQTWKEDVASGCRSAVAGGFTGLVMMPNTDPALDEPGVIGDVLGRANSLELCEVTAAAALTRARSGRQLTDIEGLHASGVRMFSDDGDSVGDVGLFRKAMETVAGLENGLVSQHAEDASMTASGHMNAGVVADRYGIGGLAVEAEESVIRRDIEVAEETGAHLHCQHLSSAGSVELVRAAKKRGANVTAEVTPHHLALTEDDLDPPHPNLKMYPPLRTIADREALRIGLRDGAIDVVATDHAPHSRDEKAVPFEDAPRGVIGLETALPIVLDALDGDVEALFDRMSITPAGIVGMTRQGRRVEPGSPANLVVFDPLEEWVPSDFASKSDNSPFLGRPLRGRVRWTIYGGRIVYQGEDDND